MMPQIKSNDFPICLVGATGTGKSAAAMELARDSARAGRPMAILCLDAMQVYIGADIGTGKPTALEREEIPHGGLDLVEIGTPFDVAQYLKYAEAFLREQQQKGRRVLIVGGTGLYFRALTRGLCLAPQGTDQLRTQLSLLGLVDLQERLKRVDPGISSRIDLSNPRRVARAIEVMETTGISLRQWQDETPVPLIQEFTGLWIQREKEELNRRIEFRVESMFAQGWIDEVKKLIRKAGAEKVHSFGGIGYREIMEAITKNNGVACGPNSILQLRRNIAVATRRYAKRQLTWFARESNLRSVMLTGNQLLRATGITHESISNLP